MKKIFHAITSAFKWILAILDALDVLPLLAVILSIVIAIPYYMLSNYTGIAHPFLVTVISLIAITIAVLLFKKLKKERHVTKK
jgi:uncharacterized membrane protein YdjX (TVP38/TMEM64 family)